MLPGNSWRTPKLGEYIPQSREHGNREQKRGIFGEFPCFWKTGELHANSGEPCSLGNQWKFNPMIREHGSLETFLVPGEYSGNSYSCCCCCWKLGYSRPNCRNHVSWEYATKMYNRVVNPAACHDRWVDQSNYLIHQHYMSIFIILVKIQKMHQGKNVVHHPTQR